MSLPTHHFVPYMHEPEKSIEQYNATLEGIGAQERSHRHSVYGKNILEHGHNEPRWIKLIAQCKDTMIILLIVSAGIALWLNDLRTA